MARVRNYFQHRFNPLHIYCRLLDYGVSRKLASRVSGLYERWVYRLTTSGV
jgi:hypothetical protein